MFPKPTADPTAAAMAPKRVANPTRFDIIKSVFYIFHKSRHYIQ